MPKFTQKHFVHMAEEVAKGWGFETRDEKLAVVRFLACVFATDSDKFNADLFVRKCGFAEGASVLS